MTDTQKVVVKFTPSVLSHKEKHLTAARVQELGLTAYGGSREEALEEIQKMFYKFITHLRETGKLESVLEASGLDWWPENEYPAGDLPYIDTTPGQGTPTARPPKAHRPRQWDDLSPRPLGLAA